MRALGLSAALLAAAPGSLDDFIDEQMPSSGAPGVAYAIMIDGDVTEVGARGEVELGGGQPITPDTPFVTGSISKSFTALAVMQLVEAGDVDLDTGVSHYLEAFSGQPGAPITVRQLLSHTSGYSTLQGNTSRVETTGEIDELTRCVAAVAREAPAYPPGSKWEYSNTNYRVLGRLIEVVSGATYEAYVEANILEPIGMEHSFVADGAVHEEMAMGHRPWFGTKRPLALNTTDLCTAPAGGVVASARDLGRYMQVMTNSEDDILSAEGKAAMMRPASDASPFYGYGWFLDADEGSVWHSGSSPGFETLATIVPAEHKGVVVLVNAGSGMGFCESTPLYEGITARALGQEYEGEGSRWSQKALFVSLVLTPLVFVFTTLWAWRHRRELRSKLGPESGAFDLFSLWFPLLTTLAMAWVFFGLVPRLFGVSLGTLHRFQPDLGLVMIAAPVTGLFWAIFRLGLAYSGKRTAA